MAIALDFAALVLDAAAILLYLLGWVVALGLLYTWNATFHILLQKIADALTYDHHFPFGIHVHFSLGGWARDIDTIARNAFSDWAVGCEIMVGKLWYVAGWTVYTTVQEIRHLAQDTLALGHWIVHTAVPTYVDGATHLLHGLTKTVYVTAHAAEAKAANLTRTVDTLARHSVAVLDREVAGLRERVWRDERLLHHEAAHGIDDLESEFWKLYKRVGVLTGATVFAAAMANVLGVSARCLRKGNIGRVSRALCGLSGAALNDLLGLLTDVLIFENVCTLLPILETAASDIGTPLVAALTDVGAGLCGGVAPAGALRGPAPTISPVLFGTVAAGT